MLVLFETSAGYAIFKLLDNKIIKSVDSVEAAFATPEAAKKRYNLVMYYKNLHIKCETKSIRTI